MPRSGKDKILVVCVDRDNDLGEKTSVKGPLIGKESVMKGASSLALADPSDSDANSMFQAVKVLGDMDKQYQAEVAVLTGDKDVGVKSDRKITRQLDRVLDRFKADYVVMVTDGAQDENIMPIIQSKVPILSVSRVIVKQAEQLESSYYKLKDFIEETLENPKFARLIFGLPAIALILYALFGMEGWRAIVGVVGAYPRGQRPDLNQGRAGERPRADRAIAQVALPPADPVYGPRGPLVELWSPEREA